MIKLPDWRNGVFEEMTAPEDYEFGWLAAEFDSQIVPFPVNQKINIHEVFGNTEYDLNVAHHGIFYPEGERGARVITLDEFKWLEDRPETNCKWFENMGIGWRDTGGKRPNPFAWMESFFNKRLAIKKKDFALQYSMKILMNSLYGKTAQYRHGFGQLTNFPYASITTARTRLKMWEVFEKNRGHIVNMATDGLLSTRKLDVPISPNLGDWEFKEYERGLVIGNGIRQLWFIKDGEETFNTYARGITDKRNWDMLGAILVDPRKEFVDVGKSRPISLGLIVKNHNVFKPEDLNVFKKLKRRLSVNTDSRRNWTRPYKDFLDILNSPIQVGVPWKVSELHNLEGVADLL